MEKTLAGGLDGGTSGDALRSEDIKELTQT
jgi:hypothetical protein